MDPKARGIIAGLTLSHTRGDLYRAALEATGFGVRHNIEAMRAAGGDIRRIVAVGGGTRGGTVDADRLRHHRPPQEIRSQTIGASYGAAFLAAQAVYSASSSADAGRGGAGSGGARTVADVSIDDWNPVREIRTPRPEHAADYDELYRCIASSTRVRDRGARPGRAAAALALRVRRGRRPRNNQ